MVKRLRRRPLTAESGVRFPMGVPEKDKSFMACFFIYLCLNLLHMGNCALSRTQRCCTNPRTLGWRSTIQTSLLVSLLRSLRSLRFPMGYQKILHDCVGFLLIPSRFLHMVFKFVHRLFINIPQKNRRSRWTAPLCLW